MLFLPFQCSVVLVLLAEQVGCIGSMHADSGGSRQ